jgi:aspartate aminotransferase
MALQLVVPGDLVIPKPCWNTYAPQAVLAGKRAIPVPIPRDVGGVPDPDLLPSVLRAARARGAEPTMIVFSNPDNPTGTFARPSLIRQLCDIAVSEGLFIVSDEIYRDVIHDPAAAFLSPAEIAPERTVVTSGLSKSLALGGWRIGVARFPDTTFGRQVRVDVTRVASEIWSTLAGPMQAVAEFVYDEPVSVRERLASHNRLHGVTARAIHQIFTAAGAACRTPGAAFYLYPDWESLRPAFAARGVVDSQGLEDYLLEQHGIAVLGGHHLGDEPGKLRFKAAISTLYGPEAEAQQAALLSDNPLELPHMAGPLRHIAETFDSVKAACL